MLPLIWVSAPVSAAACESGAYGTATIAIPTLPATGTYTIWTRMQAPNAENNQYQLEINGEACFTVGGSGAPANQWIWVASQNGNASSKTEFNFTHTTGNQARLIGIAPGVKVDRILVLQSDCVPTGTGDNCRLGNAVVIQGSSGTTAQTLQQPVSGKILPASILSDNPSSVKRVVYLVDGQKLQEAEGAVPLDTTLLSNGAHIVTARVTTTDDKTTDYATNLTVNNVETFMSPLYRWLRLNKRALAYVGGAFGILSFVLLIFWFIRAIHLERQRLKFHGF